MREERGGDTDKEQDRSSVSKDYKGALAVLAQWIEYQPTN